jgi:hypothetical protein
MFRWVFSTACLCTLAVFAMGQESSTIPAVPSLLESNALNPAGKSLPSAQDSAVLISSEQTATSTAVPDDGLTVSMMNGQSKLKLFGQFSAIGVFATDRPFSAGLPLLILPPSSLGRTTSTFDLHARQTAFGASYSGSEVHGFTPGASFLGFIQNDVLTSDAYGLLPYNAYGELKSDQWRIAAGLMNDVFNPISPNIISLGKLFGSGNTGSFRGQARLEHFFQHSDTFQWTTQLAVSEPVSTVVTNNVRILEDNGWPNLEGRLAAGIGPIQELAGGRKQRSVELGMSGAVGQLRTSRLITAPTDPEVPNRAVVNTWGLGLDGQVAISESIGFAGELFIGQGMGEYNGGVLQSFNSRTLGTIRTRGGWGEAYIYLTESLHLHTGFGIDAPLRRDLASTQFARNQTYFANLVWDVSKVLQISLEVDYRKTDYIGFDNGNGLVVLSQMLLRF